MNRGSYTSKNEAALQTIFTFYQMVVFYASFMSNFTSVKTKNEK